MTDKKYYELVLRVCDEMGLRLTDNGKKGWIEYPRLRDRYVRLSAETLRRQKRAE